MTAISRTNDADLMSAGKGIQRIDEGFPLGAWVPVFDKSGQPTGLRGDYDWAITLFPHTRFEEGDMVHDPDGVVAGYRVFRNDLPDVMDLAMETFGDFAREAGLDVQLAYGPGVISVRIRSADGDPNDRFDDFDTATWEMGRWNGHFFPADDGGRDLSADKIVENILRCVGSTIAQVHGLPADHFER